MIQLHGTHAYDTQLLERGMKGFVKHPGRRTVLTLFGMFRRITNWFLYGLGLQLQVARVQKANDDAGQPRPGRCGGRHRSVRARGTRLGRAISLADPDLDSMGFFGPALDFGRALARDMGLYATSFVIRPQLRMGVCPDHPANYYAAPKLRGKSDWFSFVYAGDRLYQLCLILEWKWVDVDGADSEEEDRGEPFSLIGRLVDTSSAVEHACLPLFQHVRWGQHEDGGAVMEEIRYEALSGPAFVVPDCHSTEHAWIVPSWENLEDFDAGDIVVRPEGPGGSSDELFTATAATETPGRAREGVRGRRRARGGVAVRSTVSRGRSAVTSIGRSVSAAPAAPVPIAAAPVQLTVAPAHLLQMQHWLGPMQYSTMFPPWWLLPR